MKKKLRLDPIGSPEPGVFVAKICGTDETVIMAKSESGKAGPPGSRLGTLVEDGDHYVFETIEKSEKREANGPIQVSTDKYRNGWEKTFGRNGVN